MDRKPGLAQAVLGLRRLCLESRALASTLADAPLSARLDDTIRRTHPAARLYSRNASSTLRTSLSALPCVQCLSAVSNATRAVLIQLRIEYSFGRKLANLAWLCRRSSSSRELAADMGAFLAANTSRASSSGGVDSEMSLVRRCSSSGSSFLPLAQLHAQICIIMQGEQ